MGMQMTFLGHSGFLLQGDDQKVVIDPFLTGNALAKHSPEDITCDMIVLTHGHQDHLGDTVDIAKANEAAVVAPFEVCSYLAQQGVETVLPCNPGGRLETKFGFLAYTPAIHSSSYEGQYMGEACGVVLEMAGTRFYHMGDTTIFSDMKLIGEIYQPQILAVPIGDRFTMGPELATRAAEMIGAKVAIPIHYKTFELLKQTADGFAPKGMQMKELQPGETWEVEI